MENNLPKSAVLRQSLVAPKPVSPPGAALLTTHETARYLRVSLHTVYRLLASGKLKSVKIGRRRLIRVQSMIKFIEKLEEGGYYQ